MCLDLRSCEDGTLYIALTGGPGIPRVHPAAYRVLANAVIEHNDSIRSRHGPTINLPLCYDECPPPGRTRVLPSHPTSRANLPAAIAPSRPRKRSWRLPIAIASFLAYIAVAWIGIPHIFGSTPRDVSRPVLFEVMPSSSTISPGIAGPEIE